jgi:hypothetical protein
MRGEACEDFFGEGDGIGGGNFFTGRTIKNFEKLFGKNFLEKFYIAKKF